MEPIESITLRFAEAADSPTLEACLLQLVRNLPQEPQAKPL